MIKDELSDFNQTVEFCNTLLERVLGNKGIKTTTSSILRNLRKMLGCFGGGLYLLSEDKTNLYLFGYTETRVINSLTKVIPGNIFRFSFPVKSEDLLITRCFKQNKVITSTKLRDFFSPLVSKTFMDVLEMVGGLKFYVAVPVRGNNGVIGVMFSVFRKDFVSAHELTLLQLYANMSGLALESNVQFEQMEQKYEMERETTSMLSHELKTPIAVAHNSAQTILMSLEKYKKNIDTHAFSDLFNMAEDIQNSMDRLNRVCNSIFSLREVESKVPTDVHLLDLEKQLAGILDVYEQRAHKKGLTFRRSIVCDEKKVFAPIVQVEQIVNILLDNALKYTKKGEIALSIAVTKTALMVVVTDSGRGIPKSKREMIFGRFYRYTDWGKSYFTKTEGLGLGLYIAKKILNQIGGKIGVTDNENGKGTKFWVEVPVYSSSNIKKAIIKA